LRAQRRNLAGPSSALRELGVAPQQSRCCILSLLDAGEAPYRTLLV
jgi:hypothetical protein